WFCLFRSGEDPVQQGDEYSIHPWILYLHMLRESPARAKGKTAPETTSDISFYFFYLVFYEYDLHPSELLRKRKQIHKRGGKEQKVDRIVLLALATVVRLN